MRCLSCKYDLRSLPPGNGPGSERRCPECGRAFDPKDAATFDSDDRARTIGVRFLWVAGACSAYALLFLISTIVMVVVPNVVGQRVLNVADAAFSLIACCTPVIFVIHLSALIAAPVVSRHSRRQMWVRWWIMVVVAGALWTSAAFVFLMCFTALMM